MGKLAESAILTVISRLLITIGMAVFVPFAGWLVLTTNTNTVSLATLAASVQRLTMDVAKLADSRYATTDAVRDKEELRTFEADANAALKDHEARLRKLESHDR